MQAESKKISSELEKLQNTRKNIGRVTVGEYGRLTPQQKKTAAQKKKKPKRVSQKMPTGK
jgi:hypothetical protein